MVATASHYAADSIHHPRVIACSHCETLLLSNAGDVLVSRHIGAVVDDVRSMTLSCFDDVNSLSRQIHGDSLCGSASAWENHNQRPQGLLGGSSSEVAAPQHMTQQSPPPPPPRPPPRPPLVPVGYAPIRRSNSGSAVADAGYTMTTTTSGTRTGSTAKSFASLADLSLQQSSEDNDGDGTAISLIQSFDYSQFYEGGNGMLPASTPASKDAGATTTSATNNHHVAKTNPSITDDKKKDKITPNTNRETQSFLHGIPTFCQAFTNIKIGAISAHPLGAHALLISKAGLLYSYGANQRGQLGIGVAGAAVERPTIVTPLLENGGKAIACAAGVFHSLVVVENRHGQDQLYGFGRHDVLGLVRPHPQRADVLLPRRVQLRGSTKIAASLDHSAAVHNDGSLYVWSVNDKPLPVDLHGERAVDVSLGLSTTLVVTENGTCYSAGSSDCGMLGQGPGRTDAEQFVQVDIPKSVVGVSAGVTKVVAWTADGDVYSWGDAVETPQPVPLSAPIVQAAAGRECCFYVAANGMVSSSGRASGRLGLGDVNEEVVTPMPLYGGLRLWYCQD